MQCSFDFGAVSDVALLRERLLSGCGPLPRWDRPDPCSQLVLSMIGSRTGDEVAIGAFWSLVRRFGSWDRVAAAAPAEVQAAIAAVRFADEKAKHLVQALKLIGRDHKDYKLDFLEDWPVPRALAWLQKLPGVGPKVAASVLNFSTLRQPAFVVDTHVHRVMRRFGFVGAKASPGRAYEFIMTSTAGWEAGDLDELHQLLKNLGQSACHATTPDCGHCLLRPACHFARHGGPDPAALKPRPKRVKPVDRRRRGH